MLCLKHQNIHFTILYSKEKHQMFKTEKLETANVFALFQFGRQVSIGEGQAGPQKFRI